MLAAYIRMHVGAGDLAVIAQFTQTLGWPAVRTVAVGVLAGAGDPQQEYVEIGNVGGAAATLDALQVQTPENANRFVLQGTLAPGQSCRVYTEPAGQAGACGGGWAHPNEGDVWPAPSGWVVLWYPTIPFRGVADRWYYRFDPTAPGTLAGLAGQLTVSTQHPSDVAVLGAVVSVDASSGRLVVQQAGIPVSGGCAGIGLPGCAVTTPRLVEQHPAAGTAGTDVTVEVSSGTHVLVEGGLSALQPGTPALAAGSLSGDVLEAQLLEQVPSAVQPAGPGAAGAEVSSAPPASAGAGLAGDPGINATPGSLRAASVSASPQTTTFSGSWGVPGINWTSPSIQLVSWNVFGCNTSVSVQVQTIDTFGVTWDWPMLLDAGAGSPPSVGTPDPLSLAWTPQAPMGSESFSVGAGTAVGLNFAVSTCLGGWQVGGPSSTLAESNQTSDPAPTAGQTQNVPAVACPGITLGIPDTSLGVTLEVCGAVGLTGSPLQVEVSAPGYGDTQRALSGNGPTQVSGTPQACPVVVALDSPSYSPADSFGFDLAVAVGGQTVWTSPSLTLTSGSFPAGPASDVQLTLPGAPVVTGVQPNAGSAAGGATVQITGMCFGGATAVDFGGTPAQSFIVKSDSEISAVTPADAAGTVDVTITAASGTSATSAADRYTFAAGPSVWSVYPSMGSVAGGTTVDITGSGFSGASAVDFGGTPAQRFTVKSGSEISAVTPAHAAGTVDVTVTTVGGASGTSKDDQFTYLAAPVVTGLDPAYGSPAGGTTVAVSGYGFAGATAVSFGGTPAQSFTADSDQQIIAVSPPGSGKVDVTVTVPTGTSTAHAPDVFQYIASSTTTLAVRGSGWGPYTLTATISPAVSDGTVTFFLIGGCHGYRCYYRTTLTATPSGGVARVTWTPPFAGEFVASASWSGDSRSLGSSSNAVDISVP